MTEKEVIKELKGLNKPYLHVNMSQSYFSNVITRYNVGLLKPNTLCRFLEKFGYFKIEGDFEFEKRFEVCKERKTA